MANRLLKKVLEDGRSSCPESELRNLVQGVLEECDIFHSLFNSIDTGHIIVDKYGRIVEINQQVFLLFPNRRKKRNLEGQNVVECLPDRDMAAYVDKVLKGEEKAEERDYTIQFGSEMRTIRVTPRRIVTEKSQYMDIVLDDISEDIRKETRLRRSESLASMTTMAAGVAHEIKNPLAAMTIHTQLMRKAFQKNGGVMDAESAERYLRVIEEETEHLNKIAVDFLFAVKPMAVELRKDNLNSTVEEVISFLLPEAEEKGISVTFNRDKFLPRIEFDQRLVKQALVNLVENAFSAMEGGGELSVSTRLQGDTIRLSIRDTGCGISEEMIARIFEPYYTTKASGTGLGLTLVYKIMKEHHGDIHVESTEEKGTVFHLDFPVPQSERKALEERT